MNDVVIFALGPDVEWKYEAACREQPREIFFAEKGARVQRAKRVCASCPVRIPCLVDALERGEEFGIWGGMTPKERQRAEREILSASA